MSFLLRLLGMGARYIAPVAAGIGIGGLFDGGDADPGACPRKRRRRRTLTKSMVSDLMFIQSAIGKKAAEVALSQFLR